jgi:hypothetical protein
MNIMNDSFVKRIKRNECIVCGCGANSGGSYWPDGESGSIRLYQGLPMCWGCAAKIFAQFALYDKANRWKVTPSEWYARIVDPTRDSMNTQEHQFEEQCERWKEFDIVDTCSDVIDTVIVQGMERDNIYDMEYIHDAVCDRLEDIMSNKRPEGTQYDIILREIIPKKKPEPDGTCSLKLKCELYRAALRDYCESHPEDFPKDGYPVISYTEEKVTPLSFTNPSEWLGKVTEIKWASDGDYHGIDKVTMKHFPTYKSQHLFGNKNVLKECELIPVMIGSMTVVGGYKIHELIGFMLSGKVL